MRELPPPAAWESTYAEKSARAGPRVGITRVLSLVGVAPIESKDVLWERTAEGYLARLRVRSKGAEALRVGFTSLGSGKLHARFRDTAQPAQLSAPIILSKPGGEDDVRWGPITFGDTVDVEVHRPQGVSEEEAAFSLSRVSHLLGLVAGAGKGLGAASACQRDVACFALNATASGQVTATALLVVTNAAGSFACTGTMMNTDPFTGTPYVLTSAACIASEADAASLNSLWNYSATACGSHVARPFTRLTGGAALLARDKSKDLALVRLNDAPPASVSYSGWAPRPVAVGTAVQAAHHPMADLKKLNVGSVQTVGSALRVQFTTGVTEDGSVGAGIFADDQYLVGILSGGTSSCTNPSGLDDFAPFASMWPSVMHLLRPATRDPNYSDLWWNPSESGWGLGIADHETQLFAVWYTYREDGSPTWFVIPGGSFSQGKRFFAGDIYATRGPPYTEPFDVARVTVTKVGTASFDFAPPALAAGTALFTYSIGATQGTKQIRRQPFGDAPAAWGDDWTDIYWDPAESGWGMTIAQHGSTLFGVWYTYDTSGRPLWVVVPGGTFNADGTFSGDAYTTTGPAFSAAVFDPAQVKVSKAGDATFVFDPVSPSAKLFPVPANCKYNFIACKRGGRFIPCLGGNCYGKWISQQPYGHQSPDLPPPSCIIEYGEWSACTADGVHTRSERTRTPAGCNAPLELKGTCKPPDTSSPCTFKYGAPYGACIDGQRTHTRLSATPANCTGTPTANEPCPNNACTSVDIGPWLDCRPDNTQIRIVTGKPAGCTPNVPTAQGCRYSPPSGGPYDGTYSGAADVNVQYFNADGTPAGSPQPMNVPIAVVITNGAITVNGQRATGTIAPSGAVSFAAAGSLGVEGGTCNYSGTMTPTGGNGTVHCNGLPAYTADGVWRLSRG